MTTHGVRRVSRIGGDRGQAVSALVIVIGFALVAVILLTRVAVAAASIDKSAKSINNSGDGINVNTAAVIKLTKTNQIAQSILDSAKPLQGELAQIVGTAGSINSKAARILATADLINSTAGGIRTAAEGIDTTAASIKNAVWSINGVAGSILSVAGAIKGDTGNIAETARNINKNAAGINHKLP
jgi:hypothetical protein